MSPRTITDLIHTEWPVLGTQMSVAEAVRVLLDAGVPALAVADEDGRYRGIFGEREFMNALFPGYVRTIGYAAFVPRSIEDVLEKRRECALERIADHMNTEHVEVGSDASDVQVAETFMSHRIVVVPVIDDGRVTGLITRSEFFRALAERFLDTR
jgi:CBS domain-containing protein